MFHILVIDIIIYLSLFLCVFTWHKTFWLDFTILVSKLLRKQEKYTCYKWFLYEEYIYIYVLLSSSNRKYELLAMV